MQHKLFTVLKSALRFKKCSIQLLFWDLRFLKNSWNRENWSSYHFSESWDLKGIALEVILSQLKILGNPEDQGFPLFFHHHLKISTILGFLRAENFYPGIRDFLTLGQSWDGVFWQKKATTGRPYFAYPYFVRFSVSEITK